MINVSIFDDGTFSGENYRNHDKPKIHVDAQSPEKLVHNFLDSLTGFLARSSKKNLRIRLSVFFFPIQKSLIKII